MRNIIAILIIPVILLTITACSPEEPTIGSSEPTIGSAEPTDEIAEDNDFLIGAGKIDITPDEPIVIAGSPFPDTTNSVDIPLYARAMVIYDNEEKAAIITLDTLKYPTSLAEVAMKAIEDETGIPADRITITSSHTHSGPLYFYYEGKLTDMMVDAVKLAIEDLEPCKVGSVSTEVTGVAHNRRLMIDGEAWNTWMVNSAQARFTYPACGPIDTDLQMLAVIGQDEKYKAILWSYACHAAAVGGNGGTSISADYPGFVEDNICQELGYDIPLLFLPGACGDINPSNTVYQVGKPLSNGILKGLQNLEMIDEPELSFDTKILDIEGRKDPVFAEEEITLKWPSALESFRGSFNSTLAAAKPTYKGYICAFSIGKDFVVVTNPGELFDSIGLNIRENSPYKYTLIAEQTNGALGYIPAEQDFQLKGYEVWFGEHSICSAETGTLIQNESIDLLERLRAN